MSEDDLRALLEKIAATAGDPPEHGLDGVAARRRRRTRHRRGAVATAVALAVLAIAVSPRLGWLGDERQDVTAAETGTRARRAELPDVVELRCTPEGIVVPVGSIQPQDDGLHVLAVNTLASPTDVWVVAAGGWDTGRVRVEPSRTRRFSLPVPPGSMTVGCRIGGETQQRRVELVDVDGIFEPPELVCDEDEQATSEQPVAIDPPSSSALMAVADVVGSYGIGDEDFEVRPYGGYPTARYTEHTKDPIIEVLQAGDIVAFAHLKDGRAPTNLPARPPWTAVELTSCRSFLEGQPPGVGGTSEPQA